jgi:putative membrane protein
MAFGFVIEKFALSIKQMSIMLEQSATEITVPPPLGYSAIVGIFFVGCGTLVSLFAFVNYKMVEKKSSSIPDILLLLVVLTVGIFLVIYLINSI